MEITEVRIKLMENSDDRLQAFCSVTLDDSFVIRDLKIIDGSNGPFVAMPSRKLTSHCPQCGCKNHLRAAHCNQCGLRLQDDRAIRDQEGRAKLYADIAHPINSACREMIQSRVIAEFTTERARSEQPDYISRYDDDYDDLLGAPHDEVDTLETPAPPAATTPPAETIKPATIKPAPAERSHVEPAETEPRGPHKAPSRQRQPQQGAAKDQTGDQVSDPPDDQFGAGIF